MALLIKTARPAGQELRDLLRAVHPYEVPEFLAFPASFADEAYARWVAKGAGDLGRATDRRTRHSPPGRARKTAT